MPDGAMLHDEMLGIIAACLLQRRLGVAITAHLIRHDEYTAMGAVPPRVAVTDEFRRDGVVAAIHAALQGEFCLEPPNKAPGAVKSFAARHHRLRQRQQNAAAPVRAHHRTAHEIVAISLTAVAGLISRSIEISVSNAMMASLASDQLSYSCLIRWCSLSAAVFVRRWRRE